MKKNYRILTAFIVMLSFFTINMKSQISGTVTVNSSGTTGSGNYASFGALASALNSSGVNGPLVVNVMTGANAGVYNEQIQLSNIPGMSATNNITINGNNNLLTYNANSSQPWTLSLDDVDYLKINNLRMQGTNTNYAFVCILSGGSSNNTFTGCTFSCVANSTGYYTCPFATSDSPYYFSFPYTANNNNTVKTCTLFSGYYGAYLPGYYNPPHQTGNKIIDSRVTDFYYYGVELEYSDNTVIKGCTFDRDTRTNPGYTYLFYSYNTNGLIVENNLIRDMYNGAQTNSSSFYLFYGVGSYGDDQSNRNKVRNNIVRDIKFNGYTYLFAYSYNSAVDVYHNTFSFAQSTGSYLYGFYYSQMAQFTVENNIFNFTNSSSSYKTVYYYPGQSPSGVYNNNDYYVTGSNSYIADMSSQCTTPTQWTTLSGEALCWATDPTFANATAGDLHPTNTLLNNLGTPKLLPYDQMNNGRSQTVPDVGALEFLSNNCSGTPAANTVTGQIIVCPNGSTDLMVGNWSSDIGITYQWLSSTTSTAGPWAPITGENTVFYTTPGLNATSYFGVQIQCVNAAGATTAAIAVSIATTVVSTVPYLETFEGITKPNQLPNCSWSTNVPLGGNVSTKIGAQNNNQGPKSGTKYGSFFTYYNNATNYFFTNGIQLNTGITYSTGVFYKTDPYKSSNVTDFSIMLGTSQSATGLVSLASTNGPASSGVYTSISNTFQVATSGIYYVAVRCKSNGNYGAYALSWDDLSIDIPCQYNPVNITMSASSNTICYGDEVGFTASGADTYTWSTGDVGNTMFNTPLASDVFTVTGTSNLTGCSSSVSQYISVNLSPIVISYGSKPAICVGESVVLMATGNASSYMWSNLQGAQSIIVSPTVTTAYTVTGTNAVGCTAQSVYTVNVNSLPNVGVSSSDADQTVCEGDQVTLTGTGATSYQWAASTMFVQGPVAVVYPTSNIVYTVTGTDINGCQNNVTYALTVNVCEGLKENTLMAGLSVYPNPTNSEVNVELNNASVKSIQVLDLTGRVISTVNSDSQVTKVNMSNLANGVYYVRISTDNATSVVKVVKQ
ncbi:MAG: T9SS type A sorting domain-containing protein [Bacteroidia bacterium]|nr:T9SS type A sorting domain-containing protein [Bacteroidia bacterium]